MLLSQSCMYGIRAALLISIRNKDDEKNFIPIRQLAEKLDISFHFLTKILQILTHAKIIESYKGPNGGVRLALSKEKLFLIDIVEALDGREVFSSCLLGLPGCGDEAPCPLHDEWKKSKGQLETVFQATSLEQLARDTSNHLFRL